MSTTSAKPRSRSAEPAEHCPGWCVLRHGEYADEEDLVHLSEVTFVRNTRVRLCMTTAGHDQGVEDGPYLLLGDEEYTLDEAADLLDLVESLLARSRAATRAGS